MLNKLRIKVLGTALTALAVLTATSAMGAVNWSIQAVGEKTLTDDVSGLSGITWAGGNRYYLVIAPAMNYCESAA